MATIFYFSAQSGEQSDVTSNTFIERLFSFFSKRFAALSSEQRLDIVLDVRYFVRKLAHFSIYALLGFLTKLSLLTYELKPKIKVISSFLFCVLYAVSDEIHQTFVPNRTGMVKDVLIDSLGSAVGIAIFICLLFLIKKFKNKRITSRSR